VEPEIPNHAPVEFLRTAGGNSEAWSVNHLKRLLLGVLAAVGLGVITFGAASAIVTFDPATGTGFRR
jgi:hypothetical protein